MKVPLALYELSMGMTMSNETLFTKTSRGPQFDHINPCFQPLGLQPLYNVM